MWDSDFGVRKFRTPYFKFGPKNTWTPTPGPKSDSESKTYCVTN